MILPIPRPWRHPATGTYWFRRRVPKDMQLLLGRTEEKASLRTKDPATARRVHLEKCREVEERWARLRAGAAALVQSTGQAGTAAIAKEPSYPIHSFEPESTIPVGRPPERQVEPARRIVPWRPVFAAYAAEARLAPSTVKRRSGVMAALEERLGSDDLAGITGEELLDWKDALLASGLAPGTVRDAYLGGIKAVMNWAVANRRISANPVEGLSVKVPKPIRLRDRDLTDDEALVILTAAISPSNGRISREHAAARRWIPWLCAYGGARVNEMTQLRGCDFRVVDGIPLIRITPEAGSVKTGLRRDVPVHPHLVEQGFPTYVRERGDGPLFYDPTAARSWTSAHPLYKKIGERLAAWVRSLGVVDTGVDPNHGWRHRFKTVGRRSGISSDILDAIQGHAPRTEGEQYGRYPPEQLYDAICRMPHYPVA
ncbi:DUF6538 domain-containing protein [Methylobacterium sp.]|uniref:DUF6538 domain-containing protein n=1 Tax=Methylobacterium sp. TaxID=409 RepID=UPI003B00D8E3